MRRSTQIKVSLAIILSCMVLSFAGISLCLNKTKNKKFKKIDDLKITIKESDILGVVTEDYLNSLFIALDTNKNGKFDKSDDFVPKEYKFKFEETGKTVIFLNDPEKPLGNAKPLAYSNEFGEYIIIKMPSDYYEFIQSYNANDEAYKLDNAFAKYMKDKNIVGSVRSKIR